MAADISIVWQILKVSPPSSSRNAWSVSHGEGIVTRGGGGLFFTSFVAESSSPLKFSGRFCSFQHSSRALLLTIFSSSESHRNTYISSASPILVLPFLWKMCMLAVGSQYRLLMHTLHLSHGTQFFATCIIVDRLLNACYNGYYYFNVTTLYFFDKFIWRMRSLYNELLRM